ncbi:hypothetical protein PsW74_03574 [Pseudovibrio sp. W74]|nr:hypothetical protein PsW74_03574 [Pseudovibrio sp. W74]
MSDIGVIIGQLFGLFGDCLSNFLTAISYIHTVQSGERVQHSAPFTVLYVRT